MSCDPVLCYDPTDLAERYAQVATVLAGFAFATFSLIVSRIPSSDGDAGGRRKNLEDALITLIVAFASLIIVAIIYSAMAAETVGGAKLGIELILAGTAFAIAILALLYGLTAILAAESMTTVANWARVVAGILMPLIAVPFVLFAVTDAYALEIDSLRITGLHLAAAAGIVVVVIAIVVSWRPTLRAAAARMAKTVAWSGNPRPSNRSGHHRVAVTTIGVALSAATLFTATGFLGPEAGLHIAVGYVAIVLITLLFCFFVMTVADTRLYTDSAPSVDARGSDPESSNSPSEGSGQASVQV